MGGTEVGLTEGEGEGPGRGGRRKGTSRGKGLAKRGIGKNNPYINKK